MNQTKDSYDSIINTCEPDDERTKSLFKVMTVLVFIVLSSACIFCGLLCIAGFQYVSITSLCMIKLRKCV